MPNDITKIQLCASKKRKLKRMNQDTPMQHNINYQVPIDNLINKKLSTTEITSIFDLQSRKTNLIYIKLCGSHESAALLSQILYWFAIGEDGSIRVKFSYNDEPCLIKKRTDWEDECCLTPKQYDSAINVLKEKGYVKTEVHRSPIYKGETAIHIFLNRDILDKDVDNYILSEKKFHTIKSWNSQIGKSGITKSGNPGIPKSGNPIYKETETTTETTHVSDENIGLVKSFYEVIKKLNPAIPNKSPSQMAAWAKDLSIWRSEENRSIEDILKIIKFLEWDHFNSKSDFRWSNSVQSISKLRKHYPTMFSRMATATKENSKARELKDLENRMKENKNLAFKMAEKIKPAYKNKYFIENNHVRIKFSNGSFFPLGFSENGFKDQLESILIKNEMI